MDRITETPSLPAILDQNLSKRSTLSETSLRTHLAKLERIDEAAESLGPRLPNQTPRQVPESDHTENPTVRSLFGTGDDRGSALDWLELARTDPLAAEIENELGNVRDIGSEGYLQRKKLSSQDSSDTYTRSLAGAAPAYHAVATTNHVGEHHAPMWNTKRTAPSSKPLPVTSISPYGSLQVTNASIEASSGLYHCEFPFCPQSGRSWNTRSELAQHQRYHTPAEERPYGCDHCPSRFQLLKDLRRHQQTHKKKRIASFTCQFCKRPFTRSDNLQRHLASQHKHLQPPTKSHEPLITPQPSTSITYASRAMLDNAEGNHFETFGAHPTGNIVTPTTIASTMETRFDGREHARSSSISQVGSLLFSDQASSVSSRPQSMNLRNSAAVTEVVNGMTSEDPVDNGALARIDPSPVDENGGKRTHDATMPNGDSPTSSHLSPVIVLTRSFDLVGKEGTDGTECQCSPEECHVTRCPPEDPPRDPAIGKFMSRFQAVFAYITRSPRKSEPSTSTTTATTGNSGDAQKKLVAVRGDRISRGAKRQPEEQDEDDDEQSDMPWKGKKKSKQGLDDHRRFACPLAKSHPLVCNGKTSRCRWWEGHTKICYVK